MGLVVAVVANALAGAFIPLIGSILRLPLAVILILPAKLVPEPTPRIVTFIIGVLQDAVGYVAAIWLANLLMLRFAGVPVSWAVLLLLCLIVPWASSERMLSGSLSPEIRWFEIGCNTGRVCGLISGGLFVL